MSELEAKIDALVHDVLMREILEDFYMSTGENINANGLILTPGMVRQGFHKFPQSSQVRMSVATFNSLPTLPGAMLIYVDQNVPASEIWFENDRRDLLGRIVNLGPPL